MMKFELILANGSSPTEPELASTADPFSILVKIWL